MEPWDLRTRQLQPGYDHWECLHSACDECWNAPMESQPKFFNIKNKRRLAWVTILLAGGALLWWLNRITTPVICRVPVEQMSAFCKDLLFPR